MLNVALVMGGYSGESVVSLRSGEYYYSQIDKQKYNVYNVHILSEGWYVAIGDKKITIDKADFGFMLEGKKITFDVIVNTIHGTPGEDGQLQAYWQVLGIPYTGCSFYNSALTFNKRDTLSVLKKFDIPMADSIYLTEGQKIDEEAIINKVGLPCFVKPNKSGSSLGVSKVNKKEELAPAMANAFKEDKEILIESFLDGREISVGVMDYKGEVKVVGITEIISENDFFDFEAKYLGKSQEITPANLPQNIVNIVNERASYIYKSLNMTGFSRIDFMIVGEEPKFIEINTNPGCSPASIFPQQVAAANLNFGELVEDAIISSMKRFGK